MARRPRLQFPGAVYHVVSRGNRKSMIVDDDDDRCQFMDTLGSAVRIHRVRVYACCLMGSHYHALLDTPDQNLSDFMRTLNTDYSKAFNRRHQRVGHTFEQRFTSRVVQREKYLRRVARYIALNPVKARICADAAEWQWSTHRATAGLEDPPNWVYLDWLRWAFRAPTISTAQHSYREYVRDPTGLTWSFEPTPALGTARFKNAVADALERRGQHREAMECRRSARPSLERVFAWDAGICDSRDPLILVARETHGYRQSEIARFLGVTPSTVSKALRRARARASDGFMRDGSRVDRCTNESPDTRLALGG